ncbi:CPBP family intramembrane glutamic endopeptidase [Pedobacter sp. MC2016-24]|uniref:CPBP family intramembrane glutamic endopeptidase n=1 Tax=Pedobacter sp. MC2016-24 TaxID=2780090 RepID=UPI00187EB41A|nr:CPBP family intramembrane glutamic endopeptidase [Pedobacter sp. MC2016-24]MBE9600679.1 CPBP family intramembrane metalloprotease [Pedobacter sp. MC2016-24]
MNLRTEDHQEHSPYLQLLTLGFYAVLGLFVAMIIGFFLVFLQYGEKAVIDLSWMAGTDPVYLNAQRIMISAQQIGLFLVPAGLLAITQGRQARFFYGFKKPQGNLVLLVLLLMVCSMPLLEWVGRLNQEMNLPPFLKQMELWMKDAEDRAAETTEALLKMNNAGTFIINLLMIGMLPAVAEEMMFRGALQRTFSRIFRNPHVAIWFSAFIFSAIHLQFYGFLPRLFLGAAFGYLYFWSGSIWYAMFAHFINNGYAVCAAWYMQKNNIPLSQADQTINIAWYGYMISLVLTLLLFGYFKRQAAITHKEQTGEETIR